MITLSPSMHPSMNTPLSLIVTLLWVIIPFTFCTAQHQETVNPDRPGLSTGTYTMAPNTYQLEFGYSRSIGRSNPPSYTSVYPELLIRTGLTSKLEINLFWPGWQVINSDITAREQSRSGIVVGGKYRLSETERFNLSALLQVATPIASGTSGMNVDPTLGILWDYQGNSSLSWFGAFQLASEDAGTKRETIAQFALGSSITLTDRLGIYLEYFRSSTLSSTADVNQPLNGGFTYLITPKIQFDLYAGVGLNRSTDHFMGTGLAILF
jgi:hypothetical protein